MVKFRGTLPFYRASEKLKDAVLNLKSKGLYTKMKLRTNDGMRDSKQWLCTYKIQVAGSIGAVALVAGIAYAGNQYVQANMNEIYEVYVDDELIGEVSDPSIIESVIAAKLQQYSDEHPEVQWEIERAGLRLEQERIFMGEGEDEDTSKQLASVLEAKAVGVELVVNGKSVAIVKDEETADRILNKIKQKFAGQGAAEAVGILSAEAASKNDDDLLAQSEAVVESVRIIEPVELMKREIQPNDVMDEDDVLAYLLKGETKPTKYIVQEGDTLSDIAKKLDVPLQLIYTKNQHNKDLIERDLIRTGDVLDLTMPQPAVTIETVETVVETIGIQHDTIYEEDKTMRQGQTKTLRTGKDGKKKVTYKLTKVNGLLMDEKIAGETVIEEPIPAIVKRGTKVILGEGTGRFIWPVVSARLTSGYGTRWGRQHKGVDMISGNKSILAADNGKVVHAGTDGGYGKSVIIDHKNGYRTLYAHLSKISVKEGQTVEKGDKIGVMGDTGHSTGVHLHFEVHVNGSARNPMKYLP
ncbi:M23 family metallopeptidase [Paenibacillus alkalitolerans]|uniref:M23 family metallopeptidase n=1 Tax=Paenibacillus alkalitolerans TaxID=2799335 RepID=UPI0018F5C316|nr:peptidoglycan DD-metalloendopeptidase family protein [Paenibacillus alkalitolerans]